MNGAVWHNCRFVLGAAWNAGYFTNCSRDDFGGSTIRGRTPAGQKRAMWSLEPNCRNDTLPVRS